MFLVSGNGYIAEGENARIRENANVSKESMSLSIEA